MKFRVLSWNNEAGEELTTIVVHEHDVRDISIKRNRIGFECDDTTMVSILSALRDALNVTVFITFI